MYIFSILFLCLSVFVQANDFMSRADTHAPISIMGDHTHSVGGVMFSYRYMSMSMSDIYSDTELISPSTYFADTSYMTYTESMSMSMHMFGSMYSPSNELTLMAMVPYLENTMTVSSMAGMESDMDSNGLGDVRLSGLYQFSKSSDMFNHMSVGLNLPTGDTDITDNGMTLGYPMQLGSGTFDLLLGHTYVKFFDKFSFGSQINSVIRFGDNDSGYRLGNQFRANSWLAIPLNKSVYNVNSSFSFGLSYLSVGSIEGAHNDIMMVMNAAQDASNSGFSRFQSSVGVNFLHVSGYRVAVEYSLPLYQTVNGYQMDSDSSVTIGIQKSF